TDFRGGKLLDDKTAFVKHESGIVLIEFRRAVDGSKGVGVAGSKEIINDCVTITRVASLAEVLARDAVQRKTCIRDEMTEARIRDQDPAPSLPDPVPNTTGVGTPLSLRDRDTLHVLSS
ncbi:unnamed protein product, partial [Porites evermanni]